MLVNIFVFVLLHLVIFMYERFMNSMYDKIKENTSDISLKVSKLDIHERVHSILRYVILIAILSYDIVMLQPYATQLKTQPDTFGLLVGCSSILIIVFLIIKLLIFIYDLMINTSDLLSNNLIGNFYDNLLIHFSNKKYYKEQQKNKVDVNNNKSSIV